MTKLKQKAQSSKLNIKKDKEEKTVNIVKKSHTQVVSFRLDEEGWNNLQELLNRVNGLTKRKISTARLVKALLFLGLKNTEKKLLKALKEVSI